MFEEIVVGDDGVSKLVPREGSAALLQRSAGDATGISERKTGLRAAKGTRRKVAMSPQGRIQIRAA